MSQAQWFVCVLAVGFLLGLLTLPWRFKWSSSSAPVYLGLWTIAWPAIIIIGGSVGYYGAWIAYLREADRRRHLQSPKP